MIGKRSGALVEAMAPRPACSRWMRLRYQLPHCPRERPLSCPTPFRSLTGCSAVPEWVVADHGYSSHSFGNHIWNTGARPAIPTKRKETSVAYPEWIHNNRNIVERLWAHLNEWRTVATRHAKPPAASQASLPSRLARLVRVTTGPSTAGRLPVLGRRHHHQSLSAARFQRFSAMQRYS